MKRALMIPMKPTSSHCDNCYHQDTIIDWDTGIKKECLQGHSIGSLDCKDYDAIHDENYESSFQTYEDIEEYIQKKIEE